MMRLAAIAGVLGSSADKYRVFIDTPPNGEIIT
jgi:hypothetical protein